MVLSLLLILVFFITFSLLFFRLAKQWGLPFTPFQSFLAFGVKIALGIGYGYLFLQLYGGDDTWFLHQQGLNEVVKLRGDPIQFLLDLLPFRYLEQTESFWEGLYFYQVNLELWLIAKPLAIFNLITGGNYYVNVVLFNALLFPAHLAIYRFFINLYPKSAKTLYGFAFLYLPVVFWLSGIRAEGYLLIGFAGVILGFSGWLRSSQKRYWLFITGGAFLLIIFRVYYLIILIPFLPAWWYCSKKLTNPLKTFSIATLVAVSLFFLSVFLSPIYNGPELVRKQQQEFMQLKGNTEFALTPLKPEIGSYLKVLPEAFLNVLIRPFLWEAKGALQIAAAAQLMILWFMITWRILKPARVNSLHLPSYTNGAYQVIFITSLFICLFIGYVVPFPGAIVRYRAIPELFILSILAGGSQSVWGKWIK